MVVISYGISQEILFENLNMFRVGEKCIPWLLTLDQKRRRLDVFPELRETAKDDPTSISTIIMDDEMWVCSYVPETKQQSLQWKTT